MARDQVVVQQRQHAVGARAAGDGQDAGHAGVGKQRVDVVGALLRRAGHVAVARAQVRAFLRAEAQGAQRLVRLLVGGAFVDGAAGVDEAEGVAGLQAAGQDQGHGSGVGSRSTVSNHWFQNSGRR